MANLLGKLWARLFPPKRIPNPYPGLTWRCEACGERRPDAKISVASRFIAFPEGGGVQRNVCYCNDRPLCFEGATKIAQNYAIGG